MHHALGDEQQGALQTLELEYEADDPISRLLDNEVRVAKHAPDHNGAELAVFRESVLSVPHQVSDRNAARALDPNFDRSPVHQQALLETLADIGESVTAFSGVRPPSGRPARRRVLNLDLSDETSLETETPPEGDGPDNRLVKTELFEAAQAIGQVYDLLPQTALIRHHVRKSVAPFTDPFAPDDTTIS